MNIQEQIKAVNEWQQNEMLHPLTCRNDSRHQNLIPIEEDSKVILKCLDCDYKQNHVPDVIFKFYEQGLGNQLVEEVRNILKQKLESNMNIREEARQILLDFNRKNDGLTFQEAEDKINDLVLRYAIYWKEKDNECTD